MTINNIWDTYINSYIIDAHNNMWVGPKAIPLPLATPIHVITACNPHDKILSALENTQRNKKLLLHLNSLSVTHELVKGCSPDMEWQEKSFAVTGLSRTQICKLALRYHQRGIFELTEDEVLVIDTENITVHRRQSRIFT